MKVLRRRSEGLPAGFHQPSLHILNPKPSAPLDPEQKKVAALAKELTPQQKALKKLVHTQTRNDWGVECRV